MEDISSRQSLPTSSLFWRLRRGVALQGAIHLHLGVALEGLVVDAAAHDPNFHGKSFRCVVLDART